MLESVLVANRGEIALRIVRTLRGMGVRSITVFSDADADAPHVRAADEAVRLGPAPAAESYLSPDRVLAAARATGAAAIHPGYGFLSENAAFARAVRDAGIAFVGPSPEAMEALGDKVAAKAAAHRADVPVLPGLDRPGLTDEEIVAFVEGDASVLPVMVKAAAGGGGRGMRVVHEASELPGALGSARREALAGFGDDTLLVERFVPRARHVEVQVLADAHGTVVHLGERECSLQRRHQKVVEESPSPVVTAEVRERLGAAATRLFREVGYVGAGTAEFLMPYDATDEFFFLEVNARLQVEHPVTECVTGLDLVALQVRVASGEPLGLTQDDVVLSGHAVEARVCAEDPTAGFLPATGELLDWREPDLPDVRTDSGVERGSRVGSDYDSLLAKVVAHGPDREAAFALLVRALGDLRATGVTTNAGFLRRLVAAEQVRAGDMDTGLIERGVCAAGATQDEHREALVAAAVAETLALSDGARGDDPWDALVGWRVEGPAPVVVRLRDGHAGAGDAPTVVRVRATDDGLRVAVRADGADDAGPGAAGGHDPSAPAGDAIDVAGASLSDGELVLFRDGRRQTWRHAQDGPDRWVSRGADAFRFALVEPTVEGSDAAADGALEAPMPGVVLSVAAQEGDTVREGQVLVVIESMKMELSLKAPAEATVAAVHVTAGGSVKQGQTVLELEAVEA